MFFVFRFLLVSLSPDPDFPQLGGGQVERRGGIGVVLHGCDGCLTDVRRLSDVRAAAG